MMLLLMALAFAVQDDAAATEALATYDAEFPKAKDATSRVALIQTLSQTVHEKIIPKLGNALSHADKPVRIAAANGLKNFTTGNPAQKKAATKALVDGAALTINGKDPEVKEALLGALGALQDESAIPTIKTNLDDKSLRITSAAVQAAVALRHKNLIEPLISLLQESEKTLRAAANPTLKGKKPTSAKKDANDPEELKVERAGNLIPVVQASLETLTGQKQPDGDSWDRWWSKARPNFVMKKD